MYKRRYIKMNDSEKRMVKKHLDKHLGHLSFKSKYGSLALMNDVSPDFDDLMIEDYSLLEVKGYYQQKLGGMLDHPSIQLTNLCKIIN